GRRPPGTWRRSSGGKSRPRCSGIRGGKRAGGVLHSSILSSTQSYWQQTCWTTTSNADPVVLPLLLKRTKQQW
ncbi:hypothetical protein HaLaN_28115, partial [Haematococcus lacustris]